MARQLHASHRIGVGHFSVAASRPFTRRFFDSLEQPRRRYPVAARLTIRLGDLDQFQAVAALLRLAPPL